VPSARTASIPRSCARIGPKRRTRSPPALVATAPPTVALPRLAIRIPRSRPGSASATCCRVTPAPAVTWDASRSTGPIWFRRVRLSTTSPCSGTPPPTRPVFPPCGTTATPAPVHRARTAATSAVSRGRTTAGVWPWKRPVQSTAKPAVASPVSTCGSPTMAASDSSSVLGSVIIRSGLSAVRQGMSTAADHGPPDGRLERTREGVLDR
jgi:hypothetical protein